VRFSTMRLLMLILAFTSVETSAQEVIQRADFYSRTSLGSLAWLPNVTRSEAARKSDRFVSLASFDCVVLPTTENYFVVNHRSSDFDNWAFAAVRVVSRFSNRPKFSVHWDRRGGWFEDDSKNETTTPTLSPALSVEQIEFMKAHNLTASATRSWIQSQSADFHARLAIPQSNSRSRPGPDTWSYKSAFSFDSLPLTLLETDQISYRNHRFKFIPGVVSRSPLRFKVSRRGARSQFIVLDIPGFLPIPDRKSIEIRFGSKFSSC